MCDLGQATANIILAAADLGIGSGHSAVMDQKQAQRVLGFPAAAHDIRLPDLGQDLRNPRQHVVHTFLDGGVHGLIDIEGVGDVGGARRPGG